MNTDIGVITYNDGKNIGKLLNSLINQKLKNVNVNEIIVVSSGCTDNTNEIVKKFSMMDSRIKLLTEKTRKGKVSAINKFINVSKSDILVQISGDVLPELNAIEELCKPLSNPSIGIVACHPMPVDKMTNPLAIIAHFRWELQHELSLLHPKVGEMIAFRNVITKIPLNAVDEDFIACMILEKGFKASYAANSVVYNKGPETFSDLISQRRRINAGRIELQKRFNAISSDFVNFNLYCRAAIKTIPKYKKYLIYVVLAILMEAYSRLLGMYDHYIKKDKHIIWKISKSTKFE